MTGKGFQGIWIPKEIWQYPGLTLREKILLVEIKSLDRENGCFANNRHFADFLGISQRWVQSLLRSLREKGLISVSLVYQEGTRQVRGRVLKVVCPPSPAEQPGNAPARAGEENFMGW